MYSPMFVKSMLLNSFDNNEYIIKTCPIKKIQVQMVSL